MSNNARPFIFANDNWAKKMAYMMLEGKLKIIMRFKHHDPHKFGRYTCTKNMYY